MPHPPPGPSVAKIPPGLIGLKRKGKTRIRDPQALWEQRQTDLVCRVSKKFKIVSENMRNSRQSKVSARVQK